MAGFLDRDNRIIDMVLTNNGKRLLSQGELHFCYWIPFDDEIDYDPFIFESGSITDAQFSASVNLSIENTPIKEAVSGYRNFNSSGSDTTNVNRPMFTMAQGQTVLPRSVFPDVTGSVTITTKQRHVQTIYQDRDKTGKFVNSIQHKDMGVERFDSSAETLSLKYTKDSFPPDFQTEGFELKVLRSGSNGFVEIQPRRDMSNDLSYSNDIKIETSQKED